MRSTGQNKAGVSILLTSAITGEAFGAKIFSYEFMAEDLFNYYHTSGIEKATVLGHSMGGKVAMLFACLYPEKVTQLIVADIAPKAYPPHHQQI